ncbi:glycoside hydrolase family 3 C-terminal domain-containing protein [Rhizoctonia solani]|nr:glycoside hydrolase family 3 C-terminal domain-containing protein [Rhizoctonia solani]
MSDWFGTYSADSSIKAGLDLEMPIVIGSTNLARQCIIQRCVVSQKVRVDEIDNRVRQVLKLINKVSTSETPEGAEETGDPTEKMVQLLREAAASANVLLKNDSNVLLLNPSKLKSIAIIGPNADAPVYSGGGSASLRPYKHTTDVEVRFAAGALAHKEASLLGVKQLKTKGGKPGMDIEWFHENPLKNSNTKKVHYTHGTTSSCAFIDNLPKNLSNQCWATITGIYTPEFSGIHEFGVAADGLVDLYVDGKKIVDNSTSPTPGHLFFGAASTEILGTIDLQANEPVTIVVQYASPLIAQSHGYPVSEFSSSLGYRGVCRFGGSPAFTVEEGTQDAVEAAKSSEVVVVVIGLNNDWESESYDRTDMSLPGAINQLVSAVLEANKQTVVVVISDVLFGKINPSSKLPLSFPKREEDTPSYLKFPGQNGKVHYAEGVFVGYRHYGTFKKELLFPYTQFGYLDISLSREIGHDSQVEVNVTVRNLGQVPGQEVVQIFIRDIISRLDRPVKELKGFGKSKLLALGETDKVKVSLDRYAFAYYDDWARPDGRDGDGRWVAEAGEFEVIAATSSVDGGLCATIMLAESFEWL